MNREMIGFEARGDDGQDFVDGFINGAKQWKKKKHPPADPIKPTASDLDARRTKLWIAQWNVIRECDVSELPCIRDLNARLTSA